MSKDGKKFEDKVSELEEIISVLESGDVPDNLKNHRILSLSVNSMLAGTIVMNCCRSYTIF